MPKIPTLETQAPGARPIFMDVARGGGRAGQAEAKAASAWTKAFGKIADIFDAEDTYARKTRVDAGVTAFSEGYLKEYNRLEYDPTIVGKNYQEKMNGWVDNNLERLVNSVEYESDEEKERAMIRARGMHVSNISNIFKSSVLKTTNHMHNVFHKSIANYANMLKEYGPSSDPNLAIVYDHEDGRYRLPNIGNRFDQIMTDDREITPKEYVYASEDPMTKALAIEFERLPNGNLKRIPLIKKFDDTPGTHAKLKRMFVRQVTESLLNRVESSIISAKTTDELETIQRPMTATHMVHRDIDTTGKTKKQAAEDAIDFETREVKYLDPFMVDKSGKPIRRKMTLVDYLEGVIEASKDDLSYLGRGEKKTAYKSLMDRQRQLSELYARKKESLVRSSKSETTERTNYYLTKISELNDSIINKKNTFKPKLAEEIAAGMDKNLDNFQKSLEADKKKIKALIKKAEREGMYINHSSLRRQETIIDTNAQVSMENMLMVEIREHVESKHTLTPDQKTNFEKALFEHVTKLRSPERQKRIISHYNTMFNPSMPSGYGKRLGMADEKLALNGFNMNERDYKNPVASATTKAFNDLRADIIKIASEGLVVGKKVEFQPNFKADPDEIVNWVIKNRVTKKVKEVRDDIYKALNKPLILNAFPEIKEMYNAKNERERKNAAAKLKRKTIEVNKFLDKINVRLKSKRKDQKALRELYLSRGETPGARSGKFKALIKSINEFIDVGLAQKELQEQSKQD